MKSIRLLGAALLASTTLLGAGQAFAEVSSPATPDPAETKTPISAELEVNTTPDKPVPPVDPGEGGGDNETDIEGLFGIAYAPGALTVKGQLEDSGTTTLDLKNGTGVTNAQNKHNVGVQDKTRAKDRNWSLTAQLEWTNDENGYMDGTTVTATGGNVRLNTEGTLSDLADGEVTTDAAELTIGKESATTIMTATKGKTLNGVYNYQFQNPKLVIPNSENVAAGEYSGNIVWNLSNVTE